MHLKCLLQLQEEWSGKLAAEHQKLTQELFEVDLKWCQTKEALQKALADNCYKAKYIREINSQHRVEVERLQREAWLSIKKQVGTHSLRVWLLILNKHTNILQQTLYTLCTFLCIVTTRCTGVRISLAPVKLHSSNIVAVSDRHVPIYVCESFLCVTQMEEAEKGQRRLLQQRDYELSQLEVRLSQAQADKEKAEEELQEMKKGQYRHLQQLKESLEALEKIKKELVRSQFVVLPACPLHHFFTFFFFFFRLLSFLITLLARAAESGKVPAATPKGA